MKRLFGIGFWVAVLLAGGLQGADARYLQPDPLGVEAGGPNLYVYADSNPVMNIDPEGLQFLPYSKNLNRTSAHPYRIPESLAQQLNTPYVVGAGIGVLSTPPVAGTLGVLGARAVAACTAQETRDVVLNCLVGTLCYVNGETTWNRHKTETSEAASESRSRHQSPILFPKGR